MSFAAFALGWASFAAIVMTASSGLSLPAKLTSNSNMRSDSSLNASVLKVLSSGTNVEVLNIKSAIDGKYWYYVQYKARKNDKGWIRNDLVRLDPINGQAGTLVGDRQDKISVRSAPGLKGKVRHYGLGGDLVAVKASVKEATGYTWYQIEFPNKILGWVREDLISVWEKGCIITCPDV